ncbi:MAG: GNAT family N-acetyltransferase [Acetatifactor sp.]|nr:GNAT family N-acetyltransferase [Acetatifactor sp.]MDE7114432.1 GNAT family N-acetyltransferase [Acetatifactor sp.]
MLSEITLARQEDFETVMNLYRAAVGEEGCTWDEDYPDEDDIRGDIGRGALYCARNQGGEIIAAFAIDSDEEVDRLSCWTPDLVPAGEIARLVVGRRWQNQGIARQMLAYAMEELKRRGYRGIHFLVSKTNERALRSYSKFAFEKVGETSLYGHDWYCYEKALYEKDLYENMR